MALLLEDPPNLPLRQPFDMLCYKATFMVCAYVNKVKPLLLS
jgi:hypothetical protein